MALAAAGLFALLALVAGRYGFHRDELYFIEAGHHPAWSYPDQPALVPLAARAWYGAVHGSLQAFRLVPAALVALVVLVAAATCRELGGDRRAQQLTAVTAATSSAVLAVGHLFSTTTFDVLCTATAIWLLARALRTGAAVDWVLTGLTAGVALNVKLLPGIVLACCAAGVLVAGPRARLRSPWPYLAAALALALAAPALLWQRAHGWPELAVASSIAAGASATSAPRWLVVPLQALLTGPLTAWLLVVAMLAGWRVRQHRWLPIGFLLLLAVIIVTGGKPYYTLGLLPGLLALAAIPVRRWVAGVPGRKRLLAGLIGVNLLGGALVTLPLLPARDVGPLLGPNPDLGATIGWPRLVSAVRAAADGLPAADRAHAVIVTSNYGEAGALAAARRSGTDLPPVYSGHNAFGEWGPPPPGAGPVLWVGWTDEPVMAQDFDCRRLTPVDLPWLDNEERGAGVSLCRPKLPWPRIWPGLVHLG